MQPTRPHRAPEHTFATHTEGRARKQADVGCRFSLPIPAQTTIIPASAKHSLFKLVLRTHLNTHTNPQSHNPHKHSPPVVSCRSRPCRSCPYQPDKSRSYRAAMVTPVRARQMPLSSTPLSSTPLSSMSLSSRRRDTSLSGVD